jgi:hypothetical protein
MVLGLEIEAGIMIHAGADEWGRESIFRFSGPVEIPGQLLT